MKILVVTGSSGGHIFPALSFLESLKETCAEATILLVMPRQRIETRTAISNYDVAFVTLSSLSLKFRLKSLFDLARFLKGSLESAWIVMKFRPDCIVGFGSIISIPAILFGSLLGIKTLVHEQNVIPGRANRMLVRFVDRFALSFRESKAYLRKYESKLILTGNPIRKSMQKIEKGQALSFLGLTHGRSTLLVMGGSQGSHAVNSAFVKAASQLSCKERIQVIHLCGAHDYESLKESYKASGIKVGLFDFLRPMQYAYSAADLVISRAGAASIAELLFFRNPAILVPYPFAYQHQNENAKVLEAIGAAVIIQDDSSATDSLRDILEKLLSDAQALNAMRSSYDARDWPDTHNVLVAQAVSLSKKI